MFELLLLIYLLPVLIIAWLLLKLVFRLLRNVVHLAFWLLRKIFMLIWKLVMLVFAMIAGSDIIHRNQPDK